MKNLDVISKRIAVAGISLCAVLLCASLLALSIRSIGNANAAPVNKFKASQPAENYMLFPLGISEGYVYYIYDGGASWTFEKIAISKAANETWVK